MLKYLVLTLAGAVALSGCATTPKVREVERERVVRETADRDSVISRADAWQPGVVREMERDYLVFEPFQPMVPEQRVRLEEGTPVYMSQERVETQALQPGTDVRVFFRHDPAGEPEVVAVEILTPEEAREVRALFEQTPPGHPEIEPSPETDESMPAMPDDEFHRQPGMEMD